MSYPRYFVEIESSTRIVTAAQVITFSAYLEAGNTLTSITLGNEMIEIPEADVKKISGFPEIIGTYVVDADNKLKPKT